MHANDGPAAEARLFTSKAEPRMDLVHLPLGDIEVRHNPRRLADLAGIRRLAMSIARVGLGQPLLVSRDGAGYVLVAGGRRLEAVKELGWEEVPCVVAREDDPLLRRIRAGSENMARSELSASDEASELAAYMDELGLTLEEAAEAVGISAETARERRLPLLQLPDEVRSQVQHGEVGVESAIKLVRVTRSSPQLAEELAARLSLGVLERKAFDADPAAAVAQLAAEEGETPRALCLPFSEGTRLDASEAARRICAADGANQLDPQARGKLMGAGAQAAGKLIEITVEDVVRAQGADALLTYRRNGGAVDFLVEPQFAGDWWAGALDRARSLDDNPAGKKDPGADDAKAEREQREQEARQARADNEILGNNLAVELDHLRDVPRPVAELLAGLLVDAYGAQMAHGARLARRGWWRRELKEMRSGGVRSIERPLEPDEARERIEQHLAGAETGAELVGRLAAHLVAAVGCDQRTLPPSQRRRLTLPYGGEGTAAGRIDKALGALAGKLLSRRRYEALRDELGLEHVEPLRDRRSPRQLARLGREQAAKAAQQATEQTDEPSGALFEHEPGAATDAA